MTAALTSTERVRQWRRRQRAGLVLVTVELSQEQVALLIDDGLLSEAESEDHRAVGRALLKRAFPSQQPEDGTCASPRHNEFPAGGNQ